MELTFFPPEAHIFWNSNIQKYVIFKIQFDHSIYLHKIYLE